MMPFFSQQRMCNRKHKMLERAANSCFCVRGNSARSEQASNSNQLPEDLLNTCLCMNQQIAFARRCTFPHMALFHALALISPKSAGVGNI